MQKISLLPEILFIRPFVVFLLVLYHSLAIYTGNWPEPEGFVMVCGYDNLGRFAYSFMLEIFVFISGYIFEKQLKENRWQSFGGLIKNKCIRLLVPCYLFGLIYVICFEESFSTWDCVSKILNGGGHLWFLPMLLECFVVAYLIKKNNFKCKYVLFVAFFSALVSGFVDFPLRISLTMYYFLFFYIGNLFYCKKNLFVRLAVDYKNITLLFLLYIMLFLVLDYSRVLLVERNGIELLVLFKIPLSMTIKLLTIIISFCGLLFTYTLSLYISEKQYPNKFLISIGSCSMGIYICQQFVLKYLYYYTDIVVEVESHFLPFVCFAITAVLSYLISFCLRQSKIGRKII